MPWSVPAHSTRPSQLPKSWLSTPSRKIYAPTSSKIQPFTVASDGSSRPRNTKVLRLMPLGGSITFGVGSSHGNGYRNSLRQMLVSSGYTVNMVGSRKAGSMEDSAHEGWRGYRTDEIFSKVKKSVPVHNPNLFTINAGSNDCLQNVEPNRVCNQIQAMIDYLWMTGPRSTVILSTLLENADEMTELRIRHLNEQLQQLTEGMLAERRRIILVDMHGPDAPKSIESRDGTHPNDSGYEKMARIWFKGIQEADLRGFLSEQDFQR